MISQEVEMWLHFHYMHNIRATCCPYKNPDCQTGKFAKCAWKGTRLKKKCAPTHLLFRT